MNSTDQTGRDLVDNTFARAEFLAAQSPVIESDDIELEPSEVDYIPVDRAIINSWKFLPTNLPKMTSEQKRLATRLNCLGSLFYFLKYCLKRTNLQIPFHLSICKILEKDVLKEVIRIPRAHYKTTIVTEGNSMWRSLPFLESDEIVMRTLGYGDEWIRWMKIAHNQDNRTLIVSEVITNAVKIGRRIRKHYEENSLFKYLFAEISPTSSEVWTDTSLQHKRITGGSPDGEGTYDFIGVGAALQSRHYNDITQDDLIGQNALNSEIEMAKTIEYHQLLVGAFDTEVDNNGRDNDEVVVGNDWSYKDLNAYIRKNEPAFNFTRHSALGGCCSAHPLGLPIFPEAFTLKKLADWKKRLGSYLFSCQFLNFPINPNEARFRLKDLNWFDYASDSSFIITEFNAAHEKVEKTKAIIRHQVAEGQVIEDIPPARLTRYMMVDPNHSGNSGRCRHAIVITGVYNQTIKGKTVSRIYLLESWAESCSIDSFCTKILELGTKWKLNTIYVEAVAAQKYLLVHLRYKIQAEKDKYPSLQSVKVEELKTPNTASAKRMRMDSLLPIFERGIFWVPRGNKFSGVFLEEYEAYPGGTTVDVLDVLGYGVSMWKFDEDAGDIEVALDARRNRILQMKRAS